MTISYLVDEPAAGKLIAADEFQLKSPLCVIYVFVTRLAVFFFFIGLRSEGRLIYILNDVERNQLFTYC